MSISAVGSQSQTSPLNHMLLAMLQRMEQAQSTRFSTDTAASETAKPASATAASSSGGCGAGGSSGTQLSGDVLRVLMALQEQTAPSASTASIATSASAATLSASDPAQQLFAALDTDGDGKVSQTEMESYIQQQGGTQQEADTLYASLNQSGSAGITESQLASTAQQAAAGTHGHHHHHHHGGGIANKAAQDFVQLADADKDGSVSQSEFESMVSKLGGSTAQADQDFSALTGSTGTLTASSLADALKTLDAAKVNLSSQTSPVLSVFDALAAQTKPGTSASSAA